MSKITISKVGDMLNSLPFKEKEADDQAISKVKVPEIQPRKNMERVLDKKPKQKTQKNRNILD